MRGKLLLRNPLHLKRSINESSIETKSFSMRLSLTRINANFPDAAVAIAFRLHLTSPNHFYSTSDPRLSQIRPRGGLEGAGLGASMESEDQVPWIQRTPGHQYYRGDDVSYCSADALSIGSHDAASLRRGAYPPGLATPDFSHVSWFLSFTWKMVGWV